MHGTFRAEEYLAAALPLEEAATQLREEIAELEHLLEDAEAR
jgi:hypothetical protein